MAETPAKPEKPEDEKKPVDKTVKVIPLSQIENARTKALDLMRLYYKNNPPFPVLDKEDPEREKPRVAVGFVKDVCNKRSGFLLGQDRFPGPAGIEFEDDAFQAVIQEVWDANHLEGKILSYGNDLYLNGYAAWKVVIQPLDEKKPIRINRVQPTTMGVEFGDKDDKTKENVECWTITYQRADLTWYREELYKDRILYYEGKIASQDEVRTFMGLKEEDASVVAITFRLENTDDHGYGVIPIAFAARENEEWIWGTSLPVTVRDRVDRVNEMYTNALFATAKVADPVLWLKGVKDVSGLQKDADSVWFLESPDAAIDVLQWVGVPESTITLIKQLSSQIYKECALPPLLLDSEQNIADIPSRSLKIMYTDLENAVQQDRSIISDMLYDLFEIIFRALEKSKGFNGNMADYGKDFNFTRINWGTIIPVDEKQQQEMTIAAYNAGLLDKTHAIMGLGYTEEEAEDMKKKIQKENEEAFAGGGNNFDPNADGSIDEEGGFQPNSDDETDDLNEE